LTEARKNVIIAPYTNYKIGGVTREAFFPADTGELQRIAARLEAQGTPYFILGGGSNVLVGDRYWDGAVIFTTGMDRYDSQSDRIVCGGGIESSRVAEIALEHDKTGLEFLYLLPGTIGGAVAVNARYGMKNVSDAVLSLIATQSGRSMKTFMRKDIEFAYKHNSIAGEGWFIGEVTLAWRDGDRGEIRQRMDDIDRERGEGHHFDYPSCGCIFKNDHERNIQVGRLLDELGFKGYGVGPARVSEHHANFIVNTGNATAYDVLSIIEHIERTVKERTGIELEREVRLLGSF